MASGLRVLGVDPGTVITGYGIVEESGAGLAAVAYGIIVAKPMANTPLGVRLLRIFEGLKQLIALHGVQALAIERAFVSRNPQSALMIGHARAAAILAAQSTELPVYEYTPSAVKKAATGSGRASKQQVQSVVAKLLGLEPPPEPTDVTDALAVALCCHNRAHLELGDTTHAKH